MREGARVAIDLFVTVVGPTGLTLDATIAGGGCELLD
jgi:hypothetical protein